MKSRRIKHFLRLGYPLWAVDRGDHFEVEYPDLPGCRVRDVDLRRAYAKADAARRQWITEAVLIDAPVPLPSSHLDEGVPPRPRRSEEITGSGDAPVGR